MSIEIKIDLLELEEFLQAYILNRAKGHTGGLDGKTATKEGLRAYKMIKEIIRDEY